MFERPWGILQGIINRLGYIEDEDCISLQRDLPSVQLLRFLPDTFEEFCSCRLHHGDQ